MPGGGAGRWAGVPRGRRGAGLLAMLLLRCVGLTATALPGGVRHALASKGMGAGALAPVLGACEEARGGEAWGADDGELRQQLAEQCAFAPSAVSAFSKPGYPSLGPRSDPGEGRCRPRLLRGAPQQQPAVEVSGVVGRPPQQQPAADSWGLRLRGRRDGSNSSAAAPSALPLAPRSLDWYMSYTGVGGSRGPWGRTAAERRPVGGRTDLITKMTYLVEGMRGATMRGHRGRSPAITYPGFQAAAPAVPKPKEREPSPFRFVERLRGLSGRYEIARETAAPEDVLDAAPEQEEEESSGLDLPRMLYNRQTAWALVSEIDEDLFDFAEARDAAPLRTLAEQAGAAPDAVPVAGAGQFHAAPLADREVELPENDEWLAEGEAAHKRQIASLTGALTQLAALAGGAGARVGRSRESRSPFHAKKPPKVSLQFYAGRIAKFSGCSAGCFVVAAIYMDRILARQGQALSGLNAHRLLLGCMVAAAKMQDDFQFHNGFWAKIGGIGMEELNRIEEQVAVGLGYRVLVERPEFDAYTSLLGALRGDDVDEAAFAARGAWQDRPVFSGMCRLLREARERGEVAVAVGAEEEVVQNELEVAGILGDAKQVCIAKSSASAAGGSDSLVSAVA